MGASDCGGGERLSRGVRAPASSRSGVGGDPADEGVELNVVDVDAVVADPLALDGVAAVGAVAGRRGAGAAPGQRRVLDVADRLAELDGPVLAEDGAGAAGEGGVARDGLGEPADLDGELERLEVLRQGRADRPAARLVDL